MNQVVYHPKVPAEVRSFLEHYESISGDLGDSFWVELTEAIENARNFPGGIILTAPDDGGVT